DRLVQPALEQQHRQLGLGVPGGCAGLPRRGVLRPEPGDVRVEDPDADAADGRPAGPVHATGAGDRVLPGAPRTGRRGRGRHLPGGGPWGWEQPGLVRLLHADGRVVRAVHAAELAELAEPAGACGGCFRGRIVTEYESYRDEFPVVGNKAYLISASLGP